MRLPNSASLKETAGDRLRQARNPGQIALIYAFLTVTVSAVVIVLQYFFGDRISQTGGLQNLQSRSLFATAQSVLPIIQTAFFMCLDLGFVNAMLRIARGQYASPNSLRLGFDRFWLLVRTALLQGLIYFAICFSCFYVAFILFAISPFAERAMAIITPLVSETSILSSGAPIIDAATEEALLGSLIPFFIIYLIVVVLIGAPIYYRYRMTSYIVIDNPGMGAFRILRESKQMMKGNILALLRLDLSFWWYYLLMILASVAAYGDVILANLGIALPINETAAYFAFYFLYLAIQFGIYYYLRSRVEVTYAAAYDSIRPREDTGGAVLGNIFQM